MSPDQTYEEVYRWSLLVKAALEHDTVELAPLGNFTGEVCEDGMYRVSFKERENRKAMDTYYMRHIKNVLKRADDLGMSTIVRQLFGQKGMCAVEQGRVSDFMDDEMAEGRDPHRMEALQGGVGVSGATILYFPRL